MESKTTQARFNFLVKLVFLCLSLLFALCVLSQTALARNYQSVTQNSSDVFSISNCHITFESGHQAKYYPKSNYFTGIIFNPDNLSEKFTLEDLSCKSKLSDLQNDMKYIFKHGNFPKSARLKYFWTIDPTKEQSEMLHFNFYKFDGKGMLAYAYSVNGIMGPPDKRSKTLYFCVKQDNASLYLCGQSTLMWLANQKSDHTKEVLAMVRSIRFVDHSSCDKRGTPTTERPTKNRGN